MICDFNVAIEGYPVARSVRLILIWPTLFIHTISMDEVSRRIDFTANRMAGAAYPLESLKTGT